MEQERYTFEKPARNPIVRTFNALGHQLRGVGWERALSVEDILRRARRRSGLRDWGDDDFLEPLHLLTDAYEREAGFTSTGRWFIRELMVHWVQNRLYLHDYLRRYPEAREAALRPSIIVVGMPRTGTTLLYNLLCQDPAARPLMNWESIQPAPERTRFWGDSRVWRSRISVGLFNRLVPSLRQIHPLDPCGPEECTWLMANTFVSPVFGMFGHIPSYDDWLWALNDKAWERAYEDYVTQLLVLQHQNDGGHWVLKSPAHLMSVGPLLNAVPGATVVLTERDPAEVVPSACSLYGVLRGIGSERVDRIALGAEMLKNLSRAARRAGTVQSAHPERVLRISYRELTGDKIGTVKRIYSQVGMEFTEQIECSLNRRLAESVHVPAHRYALDQFGITEPQIREWFS